MGSKAKEHRGGFVSGAETFDGAGYWLATVRGNVYRFGDAAFLGSPVHRRHLPPIVAIASAPFGQGYWLVAATGAIYNYGTAPFCGSLVHRKLASPIVAISPAPDDGGYRLLAANGTVYGFGDVNSHGSPPHSVVGKTAIGIASSADGRGYWVATSTGVVYPFGDAPKFGSPSTRLLTSPVVSFVTSADAAGYWLVTADGHVFNEGDARFAGSLAHSPPRNGITVVGFMRSFQLVTGIVTLPHAVFGYDISNFQCEKPGSSAASKNLPPKSGISIIEVAGWLDNAYNSCLAAEVAWAKSAGTAPYNLYLFMNAPDTSAAATQMSASGPKGTCSTEPTSQQDLCRAYNYGFNGAAKALTYATTKNVESSLWWLDIEGTSLSSTANSNFSAGQYWSRFTHLNDATIQGAIDALRAAGIQVGLYSTSVQYPTIAGHFVPTGGQVPLWVAGVPWTKPPYTESNLPRPSVLAPWCAGTASYIGNPGTDVFAAGLPVMLQETPGSLASPYGIDPDYSC
ncbi:MAG TPA: hypothetical protein VKR27_03935 [Acidimicrobiales bacterium]|nr:hypothetical protein [Acidimicrobiales bacterium]